MSAATQKSPHKDRKKAIWFWLVLPFFALVMLTVVFGLLDLDHRISNLFYLQGQGWYLAKKPLWAWMHNQGRIPGVLLALVCLLFWALSYYFDKLRAWRKPCLVVVLTAVLGAGILVNAILKQYWGRPRPSQTIEYGGQWEYRPIFPPGTPGKGAAFPSGHSTMGFVFLATAAFYPRSKSLAISGVATGVVLGTLLSAARVVQGSHFTSDTIWSCGLIGMTAAALIIWLPETEVNAAADAVDTKGRSRRIRITIISLLATLLIAAGFLTQRPFYTTRSYPINIPATAESMNLLLDREPERLQVVYADQPEAKLLVDAHGFGWLKFDYRQALVTEMNATQLEVKLIVEKNSYFAELEHALTLTLPLAQQQQLQLLLNQRPLAP